MQLRIVINFLVFLSITSTSSFLRLTIPAEYRTKDTAHVLTAGSWCSSRSGCSCSRSIINRYIFRIARSSSYTKVIGSRSKSHKRKTRHEQTIKHTSTERRSSTEVFCSVKLHCCCERHHVTDWRGELKWRQLLLISDDLSCYPSV